MVTREEILQKLAKGFECYDTAFDCPTNAENVLLRFGEMGFFDMPYPVRQFISDHYSGAVTLDSLTEIVECFVQYYSEPRIIWSDDHSLTVLAFPELLVLLPNANLDIRKLPVFSYIRSDSVITDELTGEVIQEGDRIVRYDNGFTKESNVDDSFFFCTDCYRLFSSNDITPYGNEPRFVCAECYEENEYTTCPNCGEVIRRYETTTVYTEDGYEEEWCDECLRRSASRCDCCGRYFADHDYDLTEVQNGDLVCDDCLDEYYSRCECCGEYVPDSEILEDDRDYVCHRCYREHHDGLLPHEFRKVITCYHFHHDNSNKTFGSDIKRIGIENEIEGKDKCEKQLNEMASWLIETSRDESGYTHLYCEHDSSLRNGFEIITNPHTPEELFKVPFKEMFARLADEGYTSHNNGRCGLHIHFSNEWFGDDYDEIDDNVSKVIHFYSDNYDTMLKLSRRDSYSASQWAEKYYVENFAESKLNKDGSRGHSKAVNLGNMNTIHTVEFRLARGTLKYETFMAWLDMHLAIVRNSRTIAKDDTDINKWFAGISEATKEYIKERAGIEIVDTESEVA